MTPAFFLDFQYVASILGLSLEYSSIAGILGPAMLIDVGGMVPLLLEEDSFFETIILGCSKVECYYDSSVIFALQTVIARKRTLTVPVYPDVCE